MKRLSLVILGLAACAIAGCGGSGGGSSTASNSSSPPSSMSPPPMMPSPGMSGPGMSAPSPGMSPPGATGMQPGMTSPMPGMSAPMPGTMGPMGITGPPTPGTATPMGPMGITGPPTPGMGPMGITGPPTPGTATPMGPMGITGPPTPGTASPMTGTSYPYLGSSQGPMPGSALPGTPQPGTPQPGSPLGPMPGTVAGISTPMPGGAFPGAPGIGGPNNTRSAGPRSLSELADEAFRKGNDREAFQLVYAAAIANDEAAERLPDEFRWIASLKKPSLGVRWGIGVSYHPPKGYTGHPSPVGYEAPPPPSSNTPGSIGPGASGPAGTGGQAKPKKSRVFGQRDRDSQGGYGQPSGASSASPANDKPPASYPPGDPAGFLTYYTGEAGDEVVEALSKRITAGTYGPVLQHAAEVFESGPPAPVTNNFPGGIGISGPVGPMPGSVGPMPGVGPGISAPGIAGGQNNPPKPEKFKLGSIVPGVVMLGEGSESELIKTAEEQQVDFVILFEVSVRKTNKDATNNTKFRVMSLDKAKLPPAATTVEGEKPREFFVSGTINNKRVESARDDNKADPLKEEIAGFEQAIDAEIVVTPLGEKVSSEEVALKRAAFLASKAENQLASLAEIRQYQVAKLIKPKDAAELFEKILGKANAEKLLKAKTEADRAAVLSGARLLPRL